MKVLCKEGSRFLVKGKVYEVIKVHNNEIYQLSMKEPLSPEQYEWNSSWFHKMNFETIEEKRNRQLEKLGI
jgi:hypothetical protein